MIINNALKDYEAELIDEDELLEQIVSLPGLYTIGRPLKGPIRLNSFCDQKWIYTVCLFSAFSSAIEGCGKVRGALGIPDLQVYKYSNVKEALEEIIALDRFFHVDYIVIDPVLKLGNQIQGLSLNVEDIRHLLRLVKRYS